jgi:hypothetical protein
MSEEEKPEKASLYAIEVESHQEYQVHFEKCLARPVKQALKPWPDNLYANPHGLAPGRFAHYKGAIYRTVGSLVYLLDESGRKGGAYVVYCADGNESDGPYWIRSLEDWTVQVPRFKRIE